MAVGIFDSIGSGFSSAFDFMGKNKDTFSSLGSLGSGLGSIYGAYNANKLGNMQIDLANKQNNLLASSYEDEKRRRESQDASLGKVWG